MKHLTQSQRRLQYHSTPLLVSQGTVPVLQLRIEELERELASRQKCPQAAPEDHESGRSKSSEVNGQIEVIAQLEAKVETLRHSLLNEVREALSYGVVLPRAVTQN